MKYIFILLITILSCKNNTDNRLLEKQRDLSNYYKTELNQKVPGNGIIVILQNHECSSCMLSTFQNLSKLLLNNSLNKTFIIAKFDTVLADIMNSIPKSKIQVDSQHKLKDYGLDYASDLFFLFKDGELKKWFEISNENLEKIKSLD